MGGTKMTWKALRQALRDADFYYIRHTAHGELWGHEDGRRIGLPLTPSDFRSIRNAAAELKRMGVALG